jgi:hypothetical protein
MDKFNGPDTYILAIGDFPLRLIRDSGMPTWNTDLAGVS